MLLLPDHVFTLLGAILPLVCCQQHIKPLSTSASLVQNNQVYVLGSSRTGIAAVSTALQTLGYEQILPGSLPIASADPASNEGTFSVLPVELGLEKHSIMSPGAKFILVVEDDSAMQIGYPNEEGFGGEQGYGGSSRNYIRSVQDSFAQSNNGARLLEFQITKNNDRVGEDWAKLCQFLGLGYSVVERYRLRQFPDGQKEARSL